MSDELDQIKFHFDIIKKCSVKAKHGIALLATFPGSRYPYCYPRDTAACARFLRKILEKSEEESLSKEAYNLLKGIAEFILHTQKENGYWGQRYDTSCKEQSIYKQEDNVAHGMIVLEEYILSNAFLGKTPKWSEEIGNAIEKASEFALHHYYRPEINLFYTTTSIHESRIVQGFDVWTNFAYLRAFELAEWIIESVERPDLFPTIRTFRTQFQKSLFRTFTVSDSRLVRRINGEGHYDFRPDITLLAPFYFGFENRDPILTREAVETVERELWDPELDGIDRYLPYHDDFTCHLHSGNGPWMQYTAILAQYKYLHNDIEGGDKILKIIDENRTEEGFIPEHLTTPRRFKAFMATEWNTGLDARKEFDRRALIPEVSYDFIVDELVHMKTSYKKVDEQVYETENSLKFAAPLMWSHVEYGLALLNRLNILNNKL
ncbi:MAG: hypothetical protein ACE5J9_01090 [Methanosarcinales archaeon]